MKPTAAEITTAVKLGCAVAWRVHECQYKAHMRRVDPEIMIGQIGIAARSPAVVDYRLRHRDTVASSYNYPAYSTAYGICAVDDTVYWDVNRDYCGRTSPFELSKIQKRWKPATREAFVRRAVEHASPQNTIPRKIARLMMSACELPGALFGVRVSHRHVRLYDSKGKHLTDAWLLPHHNPRCEHPYWEHADTLREARAERRRKIEIAEAAAREKRITERNARLAARVAKISTKITAEYDDARALGYCAPGIEAWARSRGIDITAAVPLAILARDSDARAQKLALHLARKYVAAQRAS